MTRRTDNHAAQTQNATSPLQGDRALHLLHRRFGNKVQGLCHRIVGNRHDAEDAAQDAFVSAWTKLDSYRADGTAAGWMSRIAVNSSINTRRRNRARPNRLFTDMTGQDQDARPMEVVDQDGMTPSDAMEHDERRAAVRTAIARLSPKLQRTVRLRYLEQLTYEEVAERLGISIGTVKSRLSRAHEMLRDLLTPTPHQQSA